MTSRLLWWRIQRRLSRFKNWVAHTIGIKIYRSSTRSMCLFIYCISSAAVRKTFLLHEGSKIEYGALPSASMTLGDHEYDKYDHPTTSIAIDVDEIQCLALARSINGTQWFIEVKKLHMSSDPLLYASGSRRG